MPCSFATSCIKRTVGPSGIRSTASYQRVCCSAQKYGVVKTSCMQMICTPCFAAPSRERRCFSMFSRLISSIGRSVGAAFVHWISPHLTVRGMSESSFSKSSICLYLHQQQMCNSGCAESDKPGVSVEGCEWRKDATDPCEGTTDKRRDDRAPIPAAVVGISTFAPIEVAEHEAFPAHDPVVGNQYARNRWEEH